MKPPSGRTPVYALLGHPVRHSLSPWLHNRWFDELDIDGIYVPLELPQQPTIRLVQTIRELGLAGVNLTVPFKEQVLPGLDVLHASVEATGAANVVVRDEGRLIGHNTDGDGFMAALTAEFGPLSRGATCAILGAGGGARAVAHALLQAGAQVVHVLNRSPSRAQRLAQHLGPGVVPHALTARQFAGLAPSVDVVVNATSGRGPHVLDSLDVDLLPSNAMWIDLNYWMDDPPRLRACRTRGLRVQTGHAMLVYQAALAFELFTGHRPDARGTLQFLITRPRQPR